MSRLLERAKQDAKTREKERREKERETRKQYAAEIAAIQSRATEFVNGKLDAELSPTALTPQEFATPDDEEMAWDLTVEGLDFEVVRKKSSGAFSLYLIPDGDPENARVYIRRLADLADHLE
ncbi:MAG TPA: hypothetical protein VFJ76_07930 [Solirubrobacterales bacterium]|nr:hypothetical protein [Solirubrobacterales bacterium]